MPISQRKKCKLIRIASISSMFSARNASLTMLRKLLRKRVAYNWPKSFSLHLKNLFDDKCLAHYDPSREMKFIFTRVNRMEEAISCEMIVSFAA